jgi:hypothetical protein
MEPLEEPVPYLEEFNLCDAFGWSWRECQETPAEVRSVFLLILEARNAARKSEQKHA